MSIWSNSASICSTGGACASPPASAVSPLWNSDLVILPEESVSHLRKMSMDLSFETRIFSRSASARSVWSTASDALDDDAVRAASELDPGMYDYSGACDLGATMLNLCGVSCNRPACLGTACFANEFGVEL